LGDQIKRALNNKSSHKMLLGRRFSHFKIILYIKFWFFNFSTLFLLTIVTEIFAHVFFFFFYYYSNMGKGKGIKLQSNRTTTEKAAKKKTQTGNSKQW